MHDQASDPLIQYLIFGLCWLSQVEKPNILQIIDSLLSAFIP